MAEEKPSFSVGNQIWPGVSNVGGNLSEEKQKDIRQLITELAEYISNILENNGIVRFAFPLFKPFNAIFALTRQNVLIIMSPLIGGLSMLRFMDWQESPEITSEQAVALTRQQLGWTDVSYLQIPSVLLNQKSEERSKSLHGIAENLVEKIKQQIIKHERGIIIKPIFKTSLQDLELDPNLCFVLMPFKPEFDRIYTDILQPAVKEAGLNPLRADEVFSPTPIVEDVWAHIGKARLIIADVTDKNPNVFYELGLAHSIGKPVIIITQRKEDVPFDIAYIRYLSYTDNESGWKKLSIDLVNALKAIIK